MSSDSTSGSISSTGVTTLRSTTSASTSALWLGSSQSQQQHLNHLNQCHLNHFKPNINPKKQDETTIQWSLFFGPLPGPPKPPPPHFFSVSPLRSRAWTSSPPVPPTAAATPGAKGYQCCGSVECWQSWWHAENPQWISVDLSGTDYSRRWDSYGMAKPVEVAEALNQTIFDMILYREYK